MNKNLKEALDFHYLLLENYKKINLTENEVIVLLMIDQLLKQDNKFITADILSLKMNLSVAEIDDILSKLLNQNIIAYNTIDKNIVTSLGPLYKKLCKEFEKDIINESYSNNDEEKTKSLQNVYQQYEQLLGRPLSPIEYSQINEWINNDYSDKIIVDALREALSHQKKSFRAIDKILLQWQTRDDRKKEGYSAINDKWNKNIEETIKIAQAKWVDDDDNE